MVLILLQQTKLMQERITELKDLLLILLIMKNLLMKLSRKKALIHLSLTAQFEI